MAKGAEAVQLTSEGFNDEWRKFPPHLVLDINEEMRIAQEEIFGPLFTVMTYDSLDEVLDYINTRDAPLALYYFSNDKAIQERLFYATLSGGVTVNNCIFHVLQHSIPFGGVGASGMGHYHGYEGFMEMSKLRPRFTFPKIGKPELFYPPYTKAHARLYSVLNFFKL